MVRPAPPSLSFDRIASTYDATRGGQERGERMAADLAPLLDPARPVLEGGVGTGIVADALRRRGFAVTGVDLAPGMLRRAADAGRLPGRLVAGDLTRLPFADGSFDQAYSVWVLHVVGDKLAALGEVARVLRPGGRYLVVPGWNWRDVAADDAVGALLWDLERGLGLADVRDDGEDRLAALAPSAGLAVVERRSCAPSTHRASPEEVARRIEARSFSSLWDVGDDRWSRVVEPVLAALRSLPEPDVPVDRTSRGRLVVLRKA
jgi:SAM-dependent methyltransferase